MGEALITRRGGGGTKCASGTITGTGNGTLTITNIGFVPKVLTIVKPSSSSHPLETVISFIYDEINEVGSVTINNPSNYINTVTTDMATFSNSCTVAMSEENGGQAVITINYLRVKGYFGSNSNYFWTAAA